MANGILDLNIDDNNQDENLFLSAPEQRGLEAATFATAIGAAPSTGSLFGDLLSVAAQTGPAALATFKERQSIKEKEAEYKTKMAKNLAKKISGQFVYDTEKYNPPVEINGQLVDVPKGGNVYMLDSELAKFTGTGRFQPEKKEGNAKNIKAYSIFTTVNGQTQVQKEYLPYNTFLELEAKSQMEGSNFQIQPYEEAKNYYDTSTGKVVAMTPTEFLQKNANEPNRYRYDPDEAAALREKVKDKEATELIAGRDSVRREYQTTSELVDIYEHITSKLITAKESGKAIPTGATGDAFIFLENVAGGVNTVFQLMRDSDGPDADSNYALAAQRVEQLIERDKNIEGSLAKYLDTSTGSPGDRAQTIKSMLTQFVYAVAKSRESGGKFSVSDIDFAFMSAGRGSDPEKIVRGMTAVIAPILKSKIGKAQTAYRKTPTDNPLTDTELWQHPDFQLNQNVLRLHYNLQGFEMPEEWSETDRRPKMREELENRQKKQKDFYKNLFDNMGV